MNQEHKSLLAVLQLYVLVGESLKDYFRSVSSCYLSSGCEETLLPIEHLRLRSLDGLAM